VRVIARGAPEDDGLTTHELLVLALIADGWEHEAIARSLSASDDSFVSTESVKSAERRLIARLHARSLAHAVAIGLRSDLIC
jgi:DNA-binding NarL/FixJ family response regulator